jgi:hypothetical protein
MMGPQLFDPLPHRHFLGAVLAGTGGPPVGSFEKNF